MTRQLKSDLKTIKEIFSYLLFSLGWGFILNGNDFGGYVCLLFWVTVWVYNLYKKVQYRFGNRPEEIIFPTLNDDFAKMTSITLGAMGIIGSLVAYFAFSSSLITFLLILIAGALIFLNGYFDLPKGWIKIENQSLKISGVENTIHFLQLKEIILKNESITFVNRIGSDQNLTLLKLDPINAQRIKHFLVQKLHDLDLAVVDQVNGP